jgi:hypothetical protein
MSQAPQIGHIEEGLHGMLASCVPLGKCADAELVQELPRLEPIGDSQSRQP